VVCDDHILTVLYVVCDDHILTVLYVVCDDHILTVVFVACDIHILTALFVVCDDHIFKDDVLFYRFRIDDGTYEKDVDTKMFYKGQQIYKL
jgi:hypothetical protein